MYLSVEEFAKHLSVPETLVREWLSAEYFSNKAFFNVNNVERINLDVAIEEIHSENFGRENTSAPLQKQQTLTSQDGNLLLSDYESLVTCLFKIAYENYKLSANQYWTVNDIINEFDLETHSDDYSYDIAGELLAILQSYNLNEVINGIREHILLCYNDSDDRAQLLDALGILSDVGSIQKKLETKLHEYNSKELSSRERTLRKLGLTSTTLESLRIDDEIKLEELQEAMLEPLTGNSPEEIKNLLLLRRLKFGKLIDFDTGEILL